jgi:hypothetical protein
VVELGEQGNLSRDAASAFALEVLAVSPNHDQISSLPRARQTRLPAESLHCIVHLGRLVLAQHDGAAPALAYEARNGAQ